MRISERALWLLLLWGWFCGPALALDCPPPPAAAQSTPQTLRHPHGLLWELTAPGGGVSHLYGTIHLAMPEITALTPQVRSLLEASREFGMEVLFDDSAYSDVGASMQAAPGQSLAATATADLLEALNPLLERYGLSAEAAGVLKPWAVWTTLALPPGESGMPLDLVLLETAQAAGVKGFGLESLAEQTAAFDALPVAEQLVLLREAVCGYDANQAELHALVQDWLSGDLAALYRHAQFDEGATQRKLMSTLLDARNVRMAKRLLPHLSAGGAFVAVGAMHLPGPGGLLERLEAAGYRVRPLD